MFHCGTGYKTLSRVVKHSVSSVYYQAADCRAGEVIVMHYLRYCSKEVVTATIGRPISALSEELFHDQYEHPVFAFTSLYVCVSVCVLPQNLCKYLVFVLR